MPGRIELVPYADAVAALDLALAAARAGDPGDPGPLAPATVVVPSRRAATFARRALASGGSREGSRRGLVGVRFLTLAELAGSLAEPRLLAAGRRPLTRTVLAGAVRHALTEAPGPFAPVAGHPATEEELVRCYEQLREGGPGATARLAALPGRATEVARLCRSARELLERAFFDDVDLVEAAREDLASGAARVGGAVFVYLPERLRPLEAALLGVLGEQVPVAAFVGLVGDPVADLPVRSVVEALLSAGFVAVPGSVLLPPAGPPDPLRGAAPLPFHRLLVAGEPEAEVRAAVRLVVQAVEQGTPPERCALVAPLASSYLPLLASLLGATTVSGPGDDEPVDLPWHGPSPVTLAACPSAKVLRGLLGLAGEERLERRPVLAWLGSGPLLDRDGLPVDLAGWDRCSRLAGVLGGTSARWRWHLEGYAAEGRSEEGRSEEGKALSDPTAAACRALAEEVEELEARCGAARAAKSWRELAAWSSDALERYLGPATRRAALAWPAGGADALVLTVLGELAELDVVEAPPVLAGFAAAFERAVRRPGPPAGRLGRGVLVGPLEAAAGGRFDLMVVLGCVEGDLPGRSRPTPLLGTVERAAAGLEPEGPAVALERDRRRLAVALAGARTAVACVPEHDGPGGRVRSRSRWLARELHPERAPGLAEALASVGSGAVALSLQEVETAALSAAAGGGDGGALPMGALPVGALPVGALPVRALGPQRLAVHPLAAHLGIGEGLRAVEARGRRSFGRFGGGLGSGPLVAPGSERPLSATSLEAYASCPFRYLLASVLRCEVVEEPERRMEIDPRDRGKIVHEVLERFVADQLASQRGEAREDDPVAAERLAALAEEAFARYERRGRTGKPVLWALERQHILDWLERERRADARRQAEGWRPVAVEHAFGYGDAPPVERRAAGQPVRFRGFVDRVDRGPGGAIRVVDYKTGSTRHYKGIPDDPVDRGRHLQLPLYALAAQAAFAAPPAGEPGPASPPPPRAAFRVLGDEQLEVEVALESAVEDRLDGVLEVLVGGIRAGRFPFRPGPVDRGSFEHCRWCDFDALCPSDRERYWEVAKDTEGLAGYLALAEGTDRAG